MYPDTLAVFQTMMAVQADLNDVMGGLAWRDATLENDNGFSFRRAIFVEAGEAIAYTPYKWWAKTGTEAEPFKTELIDIVHFLLSFSHVVERSAAPFYWVNSDRVYTVEDAIQEAWFNATKRYPAEETTVAAPAVAVRHLESLSNNLYGRHTATQVTYTTFDLGGAWEELFCAFRSAFVGFSVNELLTAYLSKSMLNRFRTSNGAKEFGLSYTESDWVNNQSTYLKVWDGEEDTVHLAKHVQYLLEQGNLDADTLMAALTSQYNSMIRDIKDELMPQ